MAPRKSKSAGLPQKALFTYTQGWVDAQEQTTLDPMKVEQQADAYHQTEGPPYDQISWHQHNHATQALENLAQEFRPSKNHQLLPAPTNNLTSQKLPHFSYEAASLHGLYVPLPSYLPPHQTLYSTDFMVSSLPLYTHQQHPLTSPQQTTYAWPRSQVPHPERTLPPLPLSPRLPPSHSLQTPGPLPEELRLSPFPGSVIPPSGTIWPSPPAGQLEALQPDKDVEKQLNGQIDWEMGCRLNSALDIGDLWDEYESILGGSAVD
ncbi:hypothetical protein JMJ35_007934 [Cladonia borealis]|uniref:Uncharacterized protein n=1 Tax=Cladonia borealis TaxID=184061 RepID=A0AA39QWU2_9LECA|nr:hypothetical protein JMJ35_007934 [Cladonia borealis]